MRNNKRYRWIYLFFIFVVVFVSLYIALSYVMRPVTMYRNTIQGLYAEKSDSLDVVCIGGSSTSTFWEPYEAWKRWGMTSYDLSTDSMTPSLIKYLMIETLKTQKPRLFVVDLRAIDVREEDKSYYTEASIRLVTDSMRYSLNRHNAIRYSIGIEEPTHVNDLSLYLDLIKYHSNWQTITRDNFFYAFSNIKSYYKGFNIYKEQYHTSLEMNDFSSVDRREPLSEETEQILIDVLEYCRENNLEVLFVVNPFWQKSDITKARYNYVSDLISQYGYTFLNANDYYKEMDIDFSHDFYNHDHVNIYGADKYTLFLGEYIADNYDISDKRDYKMYSYWNEEYAEWKKAADLQKSEIDLAISKE